MKKVHLQYEWESTLKKVVMAKSDTWAQVKAKITSAIEHLPFDNSIGCRTTTTDRTINSNLG